MLQSQLDLLKESVSDVDAQDLLQNIERDPKDLVSLFSISCPLFIYFSYFNLAITI